LRSAIDTNIISTIWSAQSGHMEAKSLLSEALDRGALVICGVVYAELLAHPTVTPEITEAFLREAKNEVDCEMNKAVWHDAGIRYRSHSVRRRQSKALLHRRRIADFIIGAHALLRADRLITFNGSDFRSDFPELRIAPELSPVKDTQ
jgi:predicted nucleic acid-binding protein